MPVSIHNPAQPLSAVKFYTSLYFTPPCFGDNYETMFLKDTWQGAWRVLPQGLFYYYRFETPLVEADRTHQVCFWKLSSEKVLRDWWFSVRSGKL